MKKISCFVIVSDMCYRKVKFLNDLHIHQSCLGESVIPYGNILINSQVCLGRVAKPDASYVEKKCRVWLRG